jgi:hypothetical protein
MLLDIEHAGSARETPWPVGTGGVLGPSLSIGFGMAVKNSARLLDDFPPRAPQ